MPRGLPEGTVTFLFTDIEDSSRLWEDASADLANALRAHDTVVRGAIERHGGAVFGDGGDGFRAAFSTSESGWHSTPVKEPHATGATSAPP